MFSNVNEVIEQLRLAEAGGYKFTIEWSQSCYRDSSRIEDPWSYYFEPCFPELEVSTISVSAGMVLRGGDKVACSRDNIITPRLDDGQCTSLLPPRDRLGANDLIKRYLHLKPHVMAKVEDFKASNFRRSMIGLHVRGPGRIDGGVTGLRDRFGVSDNSVPMQPFFQQVDEALKLLPESGILACSDSSLVVEKIQERYGDRVVSYPSQRSIFGEMHASHSQNKGHTFDNHELGMDVICEAQLLASTDIFVHGNSNVANFVICANPLLIHAYIQA